MPEFLYQPILEHGHDETRYRRLEIPSQRVRVAQHLLGDIRADRFVSMIGREHAGQTLEQRAKRIGAGELPQAPSRGMMI